MCQGSLAWAWRLGVQEMQAEGPRYRAWAGQMYAQLCAELGAANVARNGHPTQRLPHNLNVSLKGIESKSLVVQFKDIAISTGSACTSAKVEPSHVIMALGFGENGRIARYGLELGRENAEAEITAATIAIVAGVRRVHKLTSALAAVT
jgi:cysteine desulfurase